MTNTTTRIFYFIIISITNNYKLNFTFYNRINLLSLSLSLCICSFHPISYYLSSLLSSCSPHSFRFSHSPFLCPFVCPTLFHDPLFPGSLSFFFLFFTTHSFFPFLPISFPFFPSRISLWLSLLRLPVRERRVVRGPPEPIPVVDAVVDAQHRAVARRPWDGQQTSSCCGTSAHAHAHASCRDDV